MDHLGRRLPVGCPVHFVLDCGEKLLRHLGVRHVVDTRRVNIQHFLVESPFGGADVADALELLVEVILLALARWILEPLVVHGEAFDEVFVQAADGPLAKLCAPMAAHAEADGKDGVQSVMAEQTRDFTAAFCSNL